MFDTIRINGKGRGNLITMKRRTGIPHWNIICRWAFCLSLTDPNPPPVGKEKESGIEMAWKTFGGINADLYEALLKQRCHDDGESLTEDNLRDQFHRHVHRGLRFMAGNKGLQNMSDLLALVC